MNAPTAMSWFLLLPLSTACGDASGGGTGGAGGPGAGQTSPAPAQSPKVDLALQRARELAAARFAEDQMEAAWELVRPLAEAPDAPAEDLLRGAIIKLAEFDPDGGLPLLERARALSPEDPAVWFNLARVSFSQGDLDALVEQLERARTLAPDDYPTTLALANAYADLDDFGHAEPLYRELLARGFEDAGAWHLTTLYRLSRLLSWDGRQEEAQTLLAEKSAFEARGVSVPQPTDLERGNFGQLPAPPARRSEAPAPAALGQLTPLAGPQPNPGDVTGWRALVIEEDWKAEGCPDTIGRADIATWGPLGAAVSNNLGDGQWLSMIVSDQPVDAALWFDVDNDGDLDLLRAHGSTLELLLSSGFDQLSAESWKQVLACPSLPAAPAALVAVDFDHEGDLDVLAVGAFGARLLRNDGVGQGDVAGAETGTTVSGAFRDVTAEAGLPAQQPFTWVVTEDLDTDQDVDLLLGGPGHVFLADNLRGGKFADASERLPAGLAAAAPPVVADLDGDGRPDLWVPSASPHVWYGRGDGRYTDGGARPKLAAVPRPEGFVLRDLDLDGRADLLWLEEDGTPHTRMGLGAPNPGEPAKRGGNQVAERDEVLMLPGARLLQLPPLAEDLDGDARFELVVLSDPGGRAVDMGDPVASVRGFALDDPRGKGLRLALRGVKDNRRGVGAIVELRAGALYRRVYWRGEPELLGLGGAPSVDLLRITWPNGVVQHMFDVQADCQLVVEQKEGLIGSCPFLYTWNGTTYEYISDVLGITPLGLPMGPGMLVPPDHDEYVLVRGDQLVPREVEGRSVYELQFTEELREVTYLDRVRLDVVDHPADVEIQPNERFCFPPFPEAHTHTTRTPLAPLRATGSDGEDWTAELAAIDDELAAPFEALKGQYLGLATPHFVELEFDAEAVRDAPLLRLYATGWLYWTDASVNMAIAGVDGLDFVPPMIQVPDGDGGWRPIGPPVGFPAGKTKTMVIDLTDAIVREDPRIRVFTTLRLYWDSLRLAVDADDAPLVVTQVEPEYAELWERGFSAPLPMHGEWALDWFEWDVVSDVPRWNQHPGLYTKLGDVLPLMGAIDDRYAILGAGDALTLRFPADDLPELPEGWSRDFLVFFDGWAKDRDPNSIQAEFVEPLPFHGMSGYPYGPDEAFPDDELHRAWRREWNTRQARRWIEPLTEPLAEPVAEAGTRPTARSDAEPAAPPAAPESAAAGEPAGLR